MRRLIDLSVMASQMEHYIILERWNGVTIMSAGVQALDIVVTTDASVVEPTLGDTGSYCRGLSNTMSAT